jgi:preprotein translocase subunit Sec61beta
LAGIVWVYGAALVIAYPFGIISFVLWRFFLEGERKESKLIPTILSLGFTLSILVLFVTWFFD